MSEHYDFHYQPTGSGAISGQQVLEQTEDAINELGDYVNDNVGGAMDVAQQALETAQTAETNAQTALDTANSFSGAIQSAQQDASTALSTAQTAQNTASNANNTAIQASQDASNAVTTANNASGQVSTLSGIVTTLGQRVTTAEGNIGQNTSDITALTTRVGTAEGNITTLQNDVSIAQGNASSAMATAGTVKQQAYVFRYSSTTLVASSTNSNALLDNTDNLKVGDKVIDSSGVLFSITAIDTANSTFTVGTALIDLAQDSDVVHKSGNETKSGELTLSDTLNSSDIVPRSNNTYDFGSVSNLLRNLYAYHAFLRGQQQGDEYSGNARTNLTLTANRDTVGTSGIIFDSFRENTAQGTGMHILGFGMKENSVRYEGLRIQWIYDDVNLGYNLNLKPNTQGTNKPLTYNLGTSADKWNDVNTYAINGLNPGSLGMPDLSNGIDISSYLTNAGTTTPSEYTPSADGYICIQISADSPPFIRMYNDYGFDNTVYTERSELGSTSGATYTRFASLIFPANKNVKVNIIIMPSTFGIISAKFFPCQGNV